MCVCLRTKLAIRLANHNIHNNQNISIQAELPPYNQIDNNPPPTYESIPKYPTTIIISDNTSSIV
jgi:hypothetical protein